MPRLKTMTGGRLLRLKENLKNEDTFMLTYGDGVSNVDLTKLSKFHKSHGIFGNCYSCQASCSFWRINN